MDKLTKHDIQNFIRNIRNLNTPVLEKLLEIIVTTHLEAVTESMDREYINNLNILYSLAEKEYRKRRWS